VREVQFIQESLDHIRVIYVPAPGFDSGVPRSISRRLQERLGPVRVDFESVAKIPPGPNGKFRAVISKVGKTAVAAEMQ
jgi:hypothetical protein